MKPQCCMCGKLGLSTIEGDGGTECELTDGRWVCSAECWDRVITPAPDLAAENERLRAALTPSQKEIVLLHIAASMGGTFDSSDEPWNWLNWFCDDAGNETDTFNRCNEKGWLFTTHNSDNDTSRIVLTAAGRAALERKP